ncbi:MAG: adenylosuccinate synthetase [Candidatus Woesebacteria bacterium]|nr:MAG: adenylosuccinate synthetase [Candidatus Woesebacteria bacterium]
MERQTAIVTGLGIGDEAKGATVEWLTRQLNAHTNLRSGGPQGGAHISRIDGREQMFSQFGAGTFEGAKTHLLHMVVSPWDLFNEAVDLEKNGVEKPLERITIDSESLILTPYHSAISRFREIMRDEKKGTVGKGVGEAIRDSKNPELSIRAWEFFEPKETLARKVEAIRSSKYSEALEIIRQKNGKEMPGAAQMELNILLNRRLVGQTVDMFSYMAGLVKIVDRSYLDDILNLPGSIVAESSQAALLDPRIGFVPHVTQVDTTGRRVINTLKDHDYRGKVIRLGVSRTYMIRHGAGPFVSYSPEMTKTLPEAHNANPVDTPWSGEFKRGHYDVVAMKYAIDATGGRRAYDGLVINFMDILKDRKEWDVCVAYDYDGDKHDLEDFFVVENGLIRGIKVHHDDGSSAHLNHLAQLTKLLAKSHPVLTTLKAEDSKSLSEVFIDFVESSLEVPVVATADGPYVEDRHIRSGHENSFG